MALKIYNTLTKSQEEFKPLNLPKVSFYQCGPTVYWIQHIGNMRAMVLADLIRRSLAYLGYDVKFARNYTDVGHLTSDEDEGEDKMAKAAKRDQLSPEKVAEKYIEQFETDVMALNCLEPDFKPRATEYINRMQEMVQTLLDKGFAYATDLAIYFDVSKAKDYTKLSGQKLEMNITDAGKGEVGDNGKKNSADFAVWFFKAGAHANALQTWPAIFVLPDGQKIEREGFPGWHLECSAMNFDIFGPTVDLHMGGIEHVPVHHTNEIAQSEAFTGAQFVRYWIHNEHLTVDGGKMSKSDGTAYSVEDVVNYLNEQYQKIGHSIFTNPALVLRFFFFYAHYRSKQNFTWNSLMAANARFSNRYYAFLELDHSQIGEINKEYKEKFINALENDFNIPVALTVFDKVLDSKDISDADKYATVLDFDEVLGLGLKDAEIIIIPAEIKSLANERLKARQNKDWAESDRLRDELITRGWQMEDGKDDYQLKKI